MWLWVQGNITWDTRSHPRGNRLCSNTQRHMQMSCVNLYCGARNAHTDLGTWWVGTECPQPEEASLKGVINIRFLEGICWEWDWGVAMLYFSWLPFQTNFRHPLDSMRGSGSLREFPDSICIKMLYWMYADCQCCPQEPSWRKHKLCLKSENRQDFISQQSFSIRGIITKCWKLFELR